MAKLTLSDLTNITGNETSAVNTINANHALIETALENTLSRDGTTPNSMSADIDLNGYDLLNVGTAFVDGSDILAGASDSELGYVDFIEVSVPNSPQANTARVYAYDLNSATRLAYKDSAGVVHPLALERVFNVKDYGATGNGSTNDTTSVAAALTALGSSSGVLYFPSGIYSLTTGTLSKTLAEDQSIKIIGDGADASTLYFASTGDGLTINFDTGNTFAWIDGSSLIVEDLGFVTNQANSGGSAITVDGAATIGNPSRPTIFSRCGFRGTTSNNSYWGNGIEITECQNVEVNDCFYFGHVLGTLGTAIAYSGATDPEHPTVLNVHNFQMQFGGVGVHCTGYVEGLNVTQSNFTQVNYGLLVDTTTAIPMFSAYGSQFNAFEACIQVIDGTASQIVGNLFFIDDTGSAGKPAVIWDNVVYSTIVGNTFIGRSGIPNGIVLQSGCTDNIIAGNTFKSNTTNIWLQASANNNVIGDNRHADGTPVFDQGTGNIFLTTTSTALSPRASDGQALGTTALMWSDLFLASGGVLNWNNGDVTATHAANTLTFAGADTAYDFQSDEAAGTTSLRITNTNNTGVTTKLGALQFHGVDTVSANKEAIRLESVPADNNWVGGSLRVYTRAADALSNICVFGTDGSVKALRPTGGLGYGTGAGGTVTQATSKATGVTLNTVCGAITMNNASLAAATIVSFTLTNSAIAATDVLVLNHISGGTPGSYTLNARAAAGSATIDVRNNTAGALGEAIVIQFAVIKAVNA